MTQETYRIAAMTRQDLDLAVAWADREGWNPGTADADCYLAADPQGFYMGFLGQTPVSSISLVRYGRGFAFLGFYMVDPRFRGQGYGLGLWRHAMEGAGDRNVGLDGVVAQQDNYRKSGFRLAFRNIRFQGKAWPEPRDSKGICPLAQVPERDVMAYDRPFFPQDRTRFIRAWIAQPNATALGLVRGKTLEGYGVIRQCRSGYKIGPLFADTPDRADRLFLALASRIPPGQPLFLDVPEPNDHALALAARYAMTPCFETARMYTGPFPDLPLDRMFGITSFEVG